MESVHLVVSHSNIWKLENLCQLPDLTHMKTAAGIPEGVAAFSI